MYKSDRRLHANKPHNILLIRWRKHLLFHRVFGLKTLEESISWFYKLSTGEPLLKEVNDTDLIRTLKPLMRSEVHPDLSVFLPKQKHAYKNLFGERGFAYVTCLLVKLRHCKERASQWLCKPIPMQSNRPVSYERDKEGIITKKRRTRHLVKRHLRQVVIGNTPTR